MNPLKSVGGRLGLGLAVVVAFALLLVNLIVVPSLERNLINAKLSQLREAAPGIGRELSSAQTAGLFDLDPTIQTAAQTADARVVYFQPLTFDPPALRVVADSNSITSVDVENDPIALKAFSAAELSSGTVRLDDARYAEAAVPVRGDATVLLRAPLHDSLRSISLVRTRLVVAGLIALGASLLVGYLAAWLFARRIRRLERAADRIAGGDFSQQVEDTGRDEVGELARAFERMRQRLAQLERARREFIANASHELRTPLFSLGGFLELMTDEDLDRKTQAEFTATMREQVDRLTKLATELLDLSRLDAGRLTVEREQVDLAGLAETLADEFRAVSRSSGHRLSVEADEAHALADEERALQIGRILVENALLHTPSGTAIRLGTERVDGTVRLTVADDGPGIPREHATQIFDRFYRLEGSKASGSGLGLAIARELAELMGGSVELESDDDVTCFALVLPESRDMSVSDEPFSREKDTVRSGTNLVARGR
jgi:signal transduction histidine kinase